jgi:hypothetical protein
MAPDAESTSRVLQSGNAHTPPDKAKSFFTVPCGLSHVRIRLVDLPALGSFLQATSCETAASARIIAVFTMRQLSVTHSRSNLEKFP